MLRPLRDLRGGRASVSREVPPPVGGWNARDPVSSMPATDAVSLINWIPRADGCETRPGYSAHLDTGTSSVVGWMGAYEYASTAKLLSAAGGKIQDVTSGSASDLGTGFTSDQWVSVPFGSSLFLCNSNDTLQEFDGTTLADSTFSGTGLTLSDVSFVHVHASRFYVVEKGTQSFWYGGTGAITGTLTEFDLSTTGSFKGELFALCSISRDSGSGPDDFFAAIFSDGTVALYQGTNPGDANNWSRIGVFKIGRPLSRRGIVQLESDVMIITERGYELLGRVLPLGQAPTGRLTVEAAHMSDKIRDEVRRWAKAVGVNEGWSAYFYARGRLVIVTVPLGTTGNQTHVFEVDRRAWCEFNIPARHWASLSGEPYFGTSGGLIRAFDDGSYADAGDPIVCDAQPAWNYFGSRSVVKKMNLVRPNLVSAVIPDIAIGCAADFKDISVGPTIRVPDASASYPVWGVAVWGVATWGATRRPRLFYTKAAALGHAIGTRLTLSTSLDKVDWIATTYVYERGGLK